MQIQQLVGTVLALHSDVDVGVTGKVITPTAVTARQLRSDDPDLHVAILRLSPMRTCRSMVSMAADSGPIDRAEIAMDLERARVEFHRLLDAAERHDAWAGPTHGTRWTNEQLLFHMVFGYMVVQRLLILVRMFGRLPDPVSRLYARVLDSVTAPFHAVNYYGSCAAANVYNRRRMGAKLDRVIASLQRKLIQESDTALRGGMHFPQRWDPFFTDYMTLADVYRYPGRHFDFHARQLSFN
jgi:hypothetical protein